MTDLIMWAVFGVVTFILLVLLVWAIVHKPKSIRRQENNIPQTEEENRDSYY